MNIKITFKSNPDEIRNVKVIATFDYILQKLLLEEMVGLMYIDIDTP